jgi:hypothetical protein
MKAPGWLAYLQNEVVSEQFKIRFAVKIVPYQRLGAVFQPVETLCRGEEKGVVIGVLIQSDERVNEENVGDKVA